MAVGIRGVADKGFEMDELEVRGGRGQGQGQGQGQRSA
jgi:hypothetical protein